MELLFYLIYRYYNDLLINILFNEYLQIISLPDLLVSGKIPLNNDENI